MWVGIDFKSDKVTPHIRQPYCLGESFLPLKRGRGTGKVHYAVLVYKYK